MAKQSDEFDDRNDDRNDDRDDRPRRRDDGPPPKKKGCGPIAIGLLVLSVLGCCGVCGFGGYWSYNLVMGGQKFADEVVAKIGSGDMTGAYKSMHPTYQSSHTQDVFEKEAKAAKLDDVSAIAWSGMTSANRVVTYTGTATLKSGSTMPLTVRAEIQEDLKSWLILEFVTSSGDKPTPPKPDDKNKPKEEEEDK